MRLTDIGYVKKLMASHHITFKKQFGQNFLINPSVPDRIADECGAAPEDAILEIGPGIGTMTQYLCEYYDRVVAVEIDRALLPVLEDTLSEYDNVTVVSGDIMKLDLHELFRTHFKDKHVTVCANLPYYITTPILMLLVESGLPIDNITVMIQKEVAERLTAPAGHPNYGAITAVISYYARVERLFNVSAGNFIPAPNVDSAVVRLEMYKEPPFACRDTALMFRLVRAAFGQRRKTLLNALSAGVGDFTKNEITAAIAAIGQAPTVRGERLSIEEFGHLADALCAIRDTRSAKQAEAADEV